MAATSRRARIVHASSIARYRKRRTTTPRLSEEEYLRWLQDWINKTNRKVALAFDHSVFWESVVHRPAEEEAREAQAFNPIAERAHARACDQLRQEPELTYAQNMLGTFHDH